MPDLPSTGCARCSMPPGMMSTRVLPAYYSDNYVSLLPGESKEIVIECTKAAKGGVTIGLRGWNLESRVVHEGSGAGSKGI